MKTKWNLPKNLLMALMTFSLQTSVASAAGFEASLQKFLNDNRPQLEHPHSMMVPLNEDFDRLQREVGTYLSKNPKFDPATCTFILGVEKVLGTFSGFQDRYPEWEAQKKLAYPSLSDPANGKFVAGLYRTDQITEKSPEIENSNERTKSYEGLKKQLLLGYQARLQRGYRPVGITLSMTYLEEGLFVDREEFASWVERNLNIERSRITDNHGGMEDKKVVFESELSKAPPMNASLLYREIQIRCQPKDVEVIIEWKDVTRYSNEGEKSPSSKTPGKK